MTRRLTLLLGLLLLLPVTALAQDCELEINAGDNMQYDRSEMSADADCGEVTVTLTHTGSLSVDQMGHNWVLTSGERKAIARAGVQAGPGSDYVPDDERIVAATDLVGGGESTSVTFDVSEMEPGEYLFLCTFPGHSAVMNGTFVLEG